MRGRAAHRVRALQLHRDSLEWRAQQGRGQDRAQAKRLLERCKGGDGARAVQWGEVWEDFLQHAQAVYGGELGGAGNTPETPAGRLEDAMSWTSTPELSSYPGELKQVIVKGKKVTKLRPSLKPGTAKDVVRHSFLGVCV